jgi:hypothetical protein
MANITLSHSELILKETPILDFVYHTYPKPIILGKDGLIRIKPFEFYNCNEITYNSTKKYVAKLTFQNCSVNITRNVEQQNVPDTIKFIDSTCLGGNYSNAIIVAKNGLIDHLLLNNVSNNLFINYSKIGYNPFDDSRQGVVFSKCTNLFLKECEIRDFQIFRKLENIYIIKCKVHRRVKFELGKFGSVGKIYLDDLKNPEYLPIINSIFKDSVEQMSDDQMNYYLYGKKDTKSKFVKNNSTKNPSIYDL